MPSRREEYLAKLRDPRWQKLRLQVFERDNWACQMCAETEITLNVHHRYYEDGKEPWEYPIQSLVTLCEECHEAETESMKSTVATLLKTLKSQFYSGDIITIAAAFYYSKPPCVEEVFCCAIEHWLTNETLAKEMVDRYLDHLQKKLDRRGVYVSAS